MPHYLTPSSTALERAHELYMSWLWDNWGYSRWARNSVRMLFWYGVAGATIAASNADHYLDLVDNGQVSTVPIPKRKLWKSASKLVVDVIRTTGMELVPWLT